jgi:hypothetical protein
MVPGDVAGSVSAGTVSPGTLSPGVLSPGMASPGRNSLADCVDTPAAEAHDTAVTATSDNSRSERGRTSRT